ncbi:MAG: hypothetical protein KDD51_15895 [Bdellovibrionales bacterium]|nr:hypothetical protein [Bdellovibrionales bacterium]MCB0417847.1 hypothetical protein [Bdellovibrionales bacterium]
MKKLAVLVFSLFLYAPGVQAEFNTDITGTNTFNDLNLDANGNPAPTVENSSVNPSEGAVLQNTVFNQTLRADNPNINNVDVSDKYGQAGSAGSAQAGKIAAIVTGAALLAAGIPKTASIIPSEVAAGYALIAKSALEFAQAAASGGAEAGNRSIENSKLRFNDDRPEAIASSIQNGRNNTANEIANKINSPELNQLLTNRGINSEDFINQLASGQLTSAEDVARALGDNTNFSEEDLFKADQIASGASAKEMESLRIQVNEDNEESSTFGGGGRGLAGALGNGGTIDQGTLGEGRGPGAHGENALASSAGSADGSTGPGGLSLGNLLGRFGKVGKDALSALGNLTLDQLHRMGLVKLRNGMNIFQKAGRSYRSFGRWRDQEVEKLPRVARHP